MKVIKNLIKRTLQVDPYSRVTPLNSLMYVGSVKHGYYIPKNYLNSNSVCYCVGAGEDISFDVELVRLFGSKVFIIDPMPYAREHYQKLMDLTNKGEDFTIDKGKFEYTYKTRKEDFNKLTYLELGIWNEKKIVKFYDPAKENYAGHSIINLQATETYIEASVDRLVNIMKEYKHKSIDLLKLEIEGSEYTVIDTIAEDKPDIKIICVEFDEFFHAKDSKYLWNIKRSADQLLKIGYKIAHTTHQYKRTFIQQDLFKELKMQE